MGKTVSLRQVRKRLEREQKRAKADANAAKHGRSKAAKDTATAERRLDEMRLDGHRRDAGE